MLGLRTYLICELDTVSMDRLIPVLLALVIQAVKFNSKLVQNVQYIA